MNQSTQSFLKKGLVVAAMASAFMATEAYATTNATPLSAMHAAASAPTAIKEVKWLNPTTAEVMLSDGKLMTIDFYGDNIFRIFRDDNGGIIRNPAATPPADILVKNPRKPVGTLSMNSTPSVITISTPRMAIDLDKATAMISVKDLSTGKTVLEQTAPVTFENGTTSLALKENPGEYFYGGGVQNGRFSHKGKVISIENQNSWTDGGVASTGRPAVME